MSASEHRLYFLLQTTAHKLKKHADAALLADGELTTAQAAVMGVIEIEGSVSQRQVADILSLRESAMTQMVARLVKAGFVSKSRSQSDGRVWHLNVTDEGVVALEAVRKSFAKVNAILDKGLGREGVEELADALKKIQAAVVN